MGLFTPAWMSENQEKALKALAKEARQEQLFEIAQKAPLLNIRLKAVAMLTDQRLLASLAFPCEKRDMFLLLMERITDEGTRLELVFFALKRSVVWVSDLPRLLSPALIVRLAERLDGQKGKDVIGFIDDQQALAQLYKKCSIQNDSEHNQMREAILKKLRDERLMEEILYDASLDKWCRRSVLWHLKDKEALIRIADTHPEKEIRTKAALELGEPGRLAEIAKVTTDVYVFKDILRKLNDLDTLADIAITQTTAFAMQALKKITNVPALLRIQTQTADTQIQAAAQARLTGYACKKCGHDNTNDPARSELCVCAKCGAENHIMERRSNVTEYRDYASGSRWDECTRCGMTRNYMTVDTGFLE